MIRRPTIKEQEYKTFLLSVEDKMRIAKEKYWMRSTLIEEISKVIPHNSEHVVYILSNDYGTGFKRTSYDKKLLLEVIPKKEFMKVID